MDDSAEHTKTPEPLTYEETPIIDPASGEAVQPQHHSPPGPVMPDAGMKETVPSIEKERIIPEATKIFSPASGSSSLPDTEQEEEIPDPDKTKPEPQTVPEKQQVPPNRRRIHPGTVLFVLMLFGLGVWLSIQFRDFLSPDPSSIMVSPTAVPSGPADAGSGAGELTPSVTLPAWIKYTVVNSTTGSAISGWTYTLPGSVREPVCDGSGCVSRGTNLPGGTRFTLAPRGEGQKLPDFRGAVLTDAAGREFTMKKTSIGGLDGYEYTANFTGTTSGGYTFTRMRGFLVLVDDTRSVDFNHFSPAGITVDFDSDDALFDQIVGSFTGVVANTTFEPLPTSATGSGGS